ncbi:MAG: polyphosphate kinase 1, partial [Clostridia bacterium]|nr:polyphosphate kinase 1 [Clostridia bacterium]
MTKVEKHNFIKGTYCNREYSWLQFNRRVLDQALDEDNPLLERCKFFAIFHSNLDEFFMVRLGSLLNESKLDPMPKDGRTGLTAAVQVKLLSAYVKGLYGESKSAFTALKKALLSEGLCLLRASELSKKDKRECEAHFFTSILPFLSPITVDQKHPFPFLENKRTYAVYKLQKDGKETFGVMPIPSSVPRLYRLNDGDGIRLIPVEELIFLFGHRAFHGYTMLKKSLIRVTRNADLELSEQECDEDYGFDFSKYMKEKVDERSASSVVRLEMDRGSAEMQANLLNALKIDKSKRFTVRNFFDFKFLFSLGGYFPEETRKKLQYAPFEGKIADELVSCETMIDKIQEKDVFLSYPFHSIQPLVRLLNECAVDPRVASIKITVYRLSENSKIVDALLLARENGKEVTAVVELCARFDEESNLRYAKILQDAGCTVFYGVGDYKVHSKIISILLSDGGKVGYITHLGTGNYNENTAEQYTDLNILTADKAIGEDASAFFRNVAVSNEAYEYQKLLVAPLGLKDGFLKEIEAQIALSKQGQP